MLREPRKTEKPVQLKKDKQTGRFQIVKLEERIAPFHAGNHGKHGGPGHDSCHLNPHDKLVGNC